MNVGGSPLQAEWIFQDAHHTYKISVCDELLLQPEEELADHGSGNPALHVYMVVDTKGMHKIILLWLGYTWRLKGSDYRFLSPVASM